MRKVEQKHQVEGSDLMHRAEQLKERAFLRQVDRRGSHPEDDDELGEYWGCDGREYFHGEGGTVVCWVGTGCPTLEFQRLENFEAR